LDCELPTSTDKYRQVPIKHRQVPTSTDKYRQVPTSTDKYRQVPTSTDQAPIKHRQVPTSTNKHRSSTDQAPIKHRSSTHKHRCAVAFLTVQAVHAFVVVDALAVGFVPVSNGRVGGLVFRVQFHGFIGRGPRGGGGVAFGEVGRVVLKHDGQIVFKGLEINFSWFCGKAGVQRRRRRRRRRRRSKHTSVTPPTTTLPPLPPLPPLLPPLLPTTDAPLLTSLQPCP
jgi:hypothetical protein